LLIKKRKIERWMSKINKFSRRLIEGKEDKTIKEKKNPYLSHRNSKLNSSSQSKTGLCNGFKLFKIKCWKNKILLKNGKRLFS
jgi:hypothetical protein